MTLWRLFSSGSEAGEARMNMFDLANLLDNDGNLQNEMMVAAFAATMLATIPVLLGNEFDVNVGLKKRAADDTEEADMNGNSIDLVNRRIVTKFKKLLQKINAEGKNNGVVKEEIEY